MRFSTFSQSQTKGIGLNGRLKWLIGQTARLLCELLAILLVFGLTAEK
jgi:hypothetical protein